MRSIRIIKSNRSSWWLAWSFACVLITALALSTRVYGTENGALPCLQQDLDAFTTNSPLYEWPYYTADKDLFGSSIAISGETMAVASPWAEMRGFTFEPAVYIYIRSAGTWHLQQKLITPIGWVSGYSQSSFGFSIGLDGDTLVVGDPAQQTTWVFERAGGVWSIAAQLPGSPDSPAFGHTVSISGERIIVGDSAAHAYIDPTQPYNLREFFPGSVSVFRRLNGVWTLEQEFSPGLPINVLLYYPMAISGDTVAVFRINTLIIYRRGAGGWAELQQLNVDGVNYPWSRPSSISMDETHIIVGTGTSVQVFQNVNGTWSLQNHLVAGGDSYFNGLGYLGLSTAVFGQSMIISDLNSAHVYELIDGSWTEQYELELGRFFNGYLGGYSPAIVALGDDAVVASNNFPPVYYPTYLMSSGYLGYASDAPSTRQFDYFSTQDIWPPYISPVTISPTELWPPNHQIVDVTLSYEAADDCSETITELTVTSDEPETGAFTGDTGPDWEIVDDHHVRLRAERAGSGDGRTYTIRVTASDELGNTSWQSVGVTVPHN